MIKLRYPSRSDGNYFMKLLETHKNPFVG